MMQTANRIAINTGILYARMAITVFISLYATRLILGALGVNDFGIFNVVGGIISMLTFLNAAMAGATQRFMSYAEGSGDFQKSKTIFNVSVVLHLVIAILVLLLFEAAGYFLFKGILKIPPERVSVAKLIFQFSVVSTLFTIISVPYDAVINAHENMLLFAILGVVEALLKLAIALYIVHTKFDHLIAYGLLIALLSILLLIVRRIYCHKKYPECEINVSRHFDKKVLKEMTAFAGWSFLGSSTSMLANYGQIVLLNMFFGTVVNASQAIANQVSGQLGVFASTMLKALNPIIDKSEGAGNRGLMLKASIIGSKVSFFLLMFLYIPVLIDMPYILRIWLKKVPDYTVVFCSLILIRNLIEQLFYTLTSSISAVGNIKTFQIYTSILCLFPLIISFIFFKLKFPAYSLYVIYILYAVINSALIIYFSKINFNLPIPSFFKNVVARCVLSFVFVMSLSSIPILFIQDGFSRFFAIVIASFISFAIGVYMVGLSKDEKKMLSIVFRSMVSRRRLSF